MLLDPRLESDSTFIIDLSLSQVRLSHNAAFPWILLIPQREGIAEILELSTYDQQVLMQEIVLASHVMQQLFQPTKLNVANLGNVVPQLHVHIVARYNHDKAWPHPIWNSGVSTVYDPKIKSERMSHLKDTFCLLKSTPTNRIEK